jgi:hypothetical protein
VIQSQGIEVVGEQSQGVKNHSPRKRVWMKFCRKVCIGQENLTKGRRGCLGEQIREGNLRKNSNKNLQGDKSLESSLNVSE